MTRIGDGLQGIAVEFGHLRVRHLDSRKGGDVPGGRILEGREDHDPVKIALGLDRHDRRENLQFLERRQLKREVGLGIHGIFSARGEGRARGPGGAGGDPAPQKGQLGGREGATFRGHQVLMILRQMDPFHEFTPIRLTRLDDWTIGATFKEARLGAHQQFPLHLVGIMALEAARLQHRANLLERHGFEGA